jgi:hypothetical protein
MLRRTGERKCLYEDGAQGESQMIARHALPIACCLVVALCTGCSQNSLLTKQDYQKSQRNFVQGDTQGAQDDFPRRSEEGDFITTMEQGYLSLVQGKPELNEMQRQARLIENRVRYHVSREARTFFYVQMPEDYYASEHEVIWLHFLLSWGYSMQGKYEAGCVEAREAGSLLSLPWSPVGHFDDATMRLMLASLWTMCGDWREAQVDLRAAWFLDNRLNWAKRLADRDDAPADLFIVLGGPGPEPEWNPEFNAANPLRTERQVSFKLRGIKSQLSIVDKSGLIIEPHLSPDADRWYERHLVRESELHELIADSAYGGKAAIHGMVVGGKIAATTSAGLLLGIGGTALGAAIMYYGNSADAIELGLLVMATSITKGTEISKEGYRESTSSFKKELDPSVTYRFVRYLPEYLWMGWSERMASFPVEVRTPNQLVVLQHPTVLNNNGMTVSISFVPDAE